MEIYHQAEDLRLLCVEAHSCTVDIQAAFRKLLGSLKTIEGRTFFGISYQGVDGEIIYKAAVLQRSLEEAAQAGCEEFLLEKGFYFAELVRDWKHKEGSIGEAFQRIAKENDVVFPFVEWYCDPDVLCMVRIDSLV